MSPLEAERFAAYEAACDAVTRAVDALRRAERKRDRTFRAWQAEAPAKGTRTRRVRIPKPAARFPKPGAR